MSTCYYTAQKLKNKHLSKAQMVYIASRVEEWNLQHPRSTRNTGKTEFMKSLARDIHCSLSTVYKAVEDSKITLTGTHLEPIQTLCGSAGYEKRMIRRRSASFNRCSYPKAKPFCDIVTSILKENKLASIDETIHRLWICQSEKIEGMTTVSTKTFYTYVHKGLVDIKPIDLPRMVRIRKKKNYKTYIPKGQKGTSIDERDPSIETREEFGHWEGDLVTGPRDGIHGAWLTLIERKTRFELNIPLSAKSSKQVYMAINSLDRAFRGWFRDIFKTFTFDNGSEFSRYKDIEKRPGTKEQRAKVYFAHPYRSNERGSNEICNQLIRRIYPKGTKVEEISYEASADLNRRINQKPRRIHGYCTAEEKFSEELEKIGFEYIHPSGRTNRKIQYLIGYLKDWRSKSPRRNS